MNITLKKQIIVKTFKLVLSGKTRAPLFPFLLICLH